LRAGTREHGEVAEDDHRILDEDAVGMLLRRVDLDHRESVGFERGDVVAPLPPGEFEVHRYAVEMRELAVGEARRRAPHEGDRATRLPSDRSAVRP
jgi:hypothetical protein